jgi:hypothetical protein
MTDGFIGRDGSEKRAVDCRGPSRRWRVLNKLQRAVAALTLTVAAIAGCADPADEDPNEGDGVTAVSGAGATATSQWVDAWASGPQLVETANLPPAPGLSGNTLRQLVHVSVGGTWLRM